MQISEIPVLDARELGFVTVSLGRREHTRQMLEATAGTFGVVSWLLSKALLPAGDWLAKKWLEKSNNPYAHEIHELADELQIPGVYALNLSYEWGCTSGVFHTENSMRLIRILDWPFPELGRHVMVVRQKGPAGAFYNVTWPGLAGSFQAAAEGRFACALNQAPMRRHRSGIILDWLKNRWRMWRSNDLPPAHLLRYVFEHAHDYAEARQMLAETPIALPVIYILCGPNPGEGCVIERLEQGAWIRELGSEGSVCAANHFLSDFNGIGHGWMPRAIQSHERHASMQAMKLANVVDWFTAPVANELSRLALSVDFGSNSMQVRGTEGIAILNRCEISLGD